MSEPRTTRRSWRAKVAAAIIAAGGVVGGYLVTQDRDVDGPIERRPTIDTSRRRVDGPTMPQISRQGYHREAVALPELSTDRQAAVSVETPEMPSGRHTRQVVTGPKINRSPRAGAFTRARASLQIGDDVGFEDATAAHRAADRSPWPMPLMVGASTYGGPLAHPGGVERVNQMMIDGNVRIVRFGEGGDDAAAIRMIEQSDRDVLVVLMFDYLPDAMVGIVGDDKIAGIIVGHAAAADYSTSQFADKAVEIDRVRQVLQSATDAPVLLAVSAVNAHDANPSRVNDSGRAWCDAFDDLAAFDGFAVYNINRFPLLEMRSLASIRSTLGLPADRPVLLFELIGTDGDSDRIRSMWRNKAERIMSKVADEGWAGIILYSRFDVDAKAYAVDQLMRYLPR